MNDEFLMNEFDQLDAQSIISDPSGTLSSTNLAKLANWSSSSGNSNSNKLIYSQVAQKVILASLSNVNLVHEILRSVYFLNFDDPHTVKLVLDAYKKWFLKEAKTPLFMQEAEKANTSCSETDEFGHRAGSIYSFGSGSGLASVSNSNSVEQIKIGYVRCLQIFYYHSSNLLFNKANFSKDKIRNVCCYLIDIYKVFIKKIKMDHYTW